MDFGFRPGYDGLQIAPVIPAGWPGFSATRHFREAQYHIQVSRRGPGHTVSLVVDGQPVVGDTLPLAPAGAVVHVTATLR